MTEIYDKHTELKYSVLFTKTEGDEVIICPKCSGDRKEKNRKSKDFSFNHKIGAGKCHHCDAVFKKVEKDMETKKEYIKPIFNNLTNLSDGLVKWFQGRSINQETLKKFKITEGLEYMPQVDKKVNTVQFNYFIDDELVNVKFRDGAKHFKMVKGAELVLYNLDAVKNQDYAVICEGEIDALSWHQASVESVVSVPNGATTGAQKLDYLNSCYSAFVGKKKIYLSTDNDDPGRNLQAELARRFGIDRCYRIDFGELKDANEFLVYHGEQKLKNLLDDAKEFPIEGTYSIEDVWSKLEDLYDNGLPLGAKTGDRNLDSHIGFMPGELTVITGIPGHGKSIFLDQMSLGLAMESDYRFAVCSPESYPLEFYFSRLVKRLIGQKFSNAKMKKSELIAAKDWLRDRFYMIMPNSGFSLDEIIEKTKTLVFRKGVKALILDPWNRIEKNQPKHMNEAQWIAACLMRIIELAQHTGIHIFLVAHPFKMQKDKTGMNYMLPNLYSISGSAHFFNMTHNGMTIFRNYETGKTEVHIQKIKWEHLGKVGMVEYQYNQENARFDVTGNPDYSNWIKTRVEKTEPRQTDFNDDMDYFQKMLDNGTPPF